MDSPAARRWEWMLAILIAAGIANAIVGVDIFFGGSGADHLLIEGHFFRFGTFGQPNPFGGFMGLLLPLSIMAGYAYAMRLFREYRKGRIQRKTSLLAVYYGQLAGQD